MNFYAVWGCASVDLQNNLVKESQSGKAIPVSMGLGTITDIDQRFMTSNIEYAFSKYDQVIFVCGLNVYEELMNAQSFLRTISQQRTINEFVVTNRNGGLSHCRYTKQQHEVTPKPVTVKEYTCSKDPESYKESVERLLSSIAMKKKTCVFVLGGASCYKMFAEDYDTFWISRIKCSFKTSNPKYLQIDAMNNFEELTNHIYEDSDIELLRLR